MTTTNPVVATKPYKVESTGFHTWTEDEIAQYEARHAVGTKARLALDLMLWTGQRGGDARVMGPQHVKNKRLLVTQEKTGRVVSLPVLPALAASIIAAKTRTLVYCLASTASPTAE
jgi:hypothetical protein